MVAKGYKNTEIGVIPEDWITPCIKEYADIISGGTPSTKISEYWGGEIRWMNSGELNLKRVFEVEGRITEIGLENSATKLIPQKCVLVGLAGQGKTRGTVAINYIPLCTNQSIAAISPFNGLNEEYLYHNLDLRYNELRSLSTGDGGRGGLNLTLLRNLQIPLPPLPEQTAIATALSDADALITATEKLIAKKKAIKQGAMQELLKPKKGWVEKTIDDVGTINYGTRIVQNKQNGGRYYVYGGGGKTFTTHKFNRENCLIISRFAISIECVRFIKEKFFLNDSGLTVKSKNNIDQNFLDYVIISKANEIYNLGAGGAQHNLNIQDFIQIKLFIPKNISEQTRIATILSDMDAEISLLEQKLEKQKLIKQGMMQNLLTGKIRFLGNIEKRAEKPKHNEQINEAVIISFLVNKFGSEGFPLSRFRYTKYSYLLHRQSEKEARGFGKHAAGPYNPANRYKGAENIALKNKYISKVQNPKSKKDAFVVNENIEGALNYFTEWYGTEIQQWIEQFKFYKNEYLEVLTTVDKAICDLKKENKSVSLQTVKGLIEADKVWKKKLDKPYFSDTEIQKAIDESNRLFGYG